MGGGVRALRSGPRGPPRGGVGVRRRVRTGQLRGGARRARGREHPHRADTAVRGPRQLRRTGAAGSARVRRGPAYPGARAGLDRADPGRRHGAEGRRPRQRRRRLLPPVPRDRAVASSGRRPPARRLPVHRSLRPAEGVAVLAFATDLVAVVGVIFGLYALALLLLFALAAATRLRDRDR